jgi:hypothetical protein
MSMTKARALVAVVLVSVLAGCANGPSISATGSFASDATPTETALSPSPSTDATGSSALSATASALSRPSQRIDVADGPMGLDVSDGHAWVVASDSGQLYDVDLGTGKSRTEAIGPSANWIKVLDPSHLVLSRYATAAGRATLEILDLSSGGTAAAYQEPIEGLDVDGDSIWALDKARTVLRIVSNGKIVGQAKVKIAPNEHIDVVGFDDSAFASADSTAVSRVGGDKLKLEATIETGGGVPFVRDGPLVWGARADSLWAIEPATDTVTLKIPLANVIEILDLDVEGDDAWIAVRHPGRVGAVIRVDLATGEQTADVPVALPAQVVIAGEMVWVTDYDSGTLLGFDR